jgi:hypothetical protein
VQSRETKEYKCEGNDRDKLKEERDYKTRTKNK